MTSEKISFVCWLWKDGFRPGVYDSRHVNRLYSQLKQHMTGAWSLTCITDDPTGIECETFPLWEIPEPNNLEPKAPNCFRRLKLWDPDTGRQFGPLVVSLDLDMTIYSDLRPLYTKSNFKAVENLKKKSGQRFCGTMFQMRPGSNPRLWDDYHPEHTPALIERCGLHGSDQSWFTIMLPTAPIWNHAEGVYWVKRLPVANRVPPNARLIYFAGEMKPWDRNCQLIAPKLYTPL